MAKIRSFVYCESIENQPVPNGMRISLTAPLGVIKPVFLPSMFSFSVFMHIVDCDPSVAHSVRIVFKITTSNEILIDTGYASIPPQGLEDTMPKELQGLMMNMDLRNVKLLKAGTYTTEVWIDQKIVDDFPIYVKAAEENA